MYKFYCYSKCSTCRKAKKYLDDHHIPYEIIDINDAKIHCEDIKKIHLKSGKDIKKIFNTRGTRYKQLNLKKRIDDLSLEDCYNLLSNDGMLMKRPILENESSVYVGFKENEYDELKQ